MYQYFIKVVPTSYVSLNGEAVSLCETHQFHSVVIILLTTPLLYFIFLPSMALHASSTLSYCTFL